MLSARHLIWVDHLFWPLQKVLEVFFQGRKLSETHFAQPVVAIKLVGKGSIIRLASLCREHSADVTPLHLITFAGNRDACALLGIENASFIRTKNIFTFLHDCWHCFIEIKKIRPGVIVNLERCSYAVSSFGLLLSIRSKSKNLFFEASRKKESKNISIYSASEISFKQIVTTCVSLLPQSTASAKEYRVEVNKRKILVNINASDFLPERRYPLKHFATLIRKLHQQHPGLEFDFTGSSGEFHYVESIVKELTGISVSNKAGIWSLEELAKEMVQASLLITGDSMPVHLAAYLQTPVVALWGPTQPSHFGYDAFINIHSVSLNLSCSPCFIHPASRVADYCKGKIDCLLKLDPLKVADLCSTLLAEGNSQRTLSLPMGWSLKDVS